MLASLAARRYALELSLPKDLIVQARRQGVRVRQMRAIAAKGVSLRPYVAARQAGLSHKDCLEAIKTGTPLALLGAQATSQPPPSPRPIGLNHKHVPVLAASGKHPPFESLLWPYPETAIHHLHRAYTDAIHCHATHDEIVAAWSSGIEPVLYASLRHNPTTTHKEIIEAYDTLSLSAPAYATARMQGLSHPEALAAAMPTAPPLIPSATPGSVGPSPTIPPSAVQEPTGSEPPTQDPAVLLDDCVNPPDPTALSPNPAPIDPPEHASRVANTADFTPLSNKSIKTLCRHLAFDIWACPDTDRCAPPHLLARSAIQKLVENQNLALVDAISLFELEAQTAKYLSLLETGKIDPLADNCLVGSAEVLNITSNAVLRQQNLSSASHIATYAGADLSDMLFDQNTARSDDYLVTFACQRGSQDPTSSTIISHLATLVGIDPTELSSAIAQLSKACDDPYPPTTLPTDLALAYTARHTRGYSAHLDELTTKAAVAALVLIANPLAPMCTIEEWLSKPSLGLPSHRLGYTSGMASGLPVIEKNPPHRRSLGM